MIIINNSNGLGIVIGLSILSLILFINDLYERYYLKRKEKDIINYLRETKRRNMRNQVEAMIANKKLNKSEP